MRADREDINLPSERHPRSYLFIVGAAAILVLAIPLYFVLQSPDEQTPEQPVSMPVVRDSAVVAPPVVDTTAAAASPTGDFTERRLAPDVPTVGAGTAAVAERSTDDSFVIDGPLLEEIEDDAEEDSTQSTIAN